MCCDGECVSQTGLSCFDCKQQAAEFVTIQPGFACEHAHKNLAFLFVNISVQLLAILCCLFAVYIKIAPLLLKTIS